MTIGKTLVDQLRATRPTDTPSSAEVQVGDSTVQVHFHETDRFSGALDRITVRGDAAPANPDTFVRERSATIARELNYLEEPLAVWELDGQESTAQIRSSPPLREGEQVTYWEVEVRANGAPEATIARYRWQPGTPERIPLAEPATYATIGRIADTLAEALRPDA